jgi:hypothetical protein
MSRFFVPFRPVLVIAGVLLALGDLLQELNSGATRPRDAGSGCHGWTLLTAQTASMLAAGSVMVSAVASISATGPRTGGSAPRPGAHHGRGFDPDDAPVGQCLASSRNPTRGPARTRLPSRCHTT